MPALNLFLIFSHLLFHPPPGFKLTGEQGNLVKRIKSFHPSTHQYKALQNANQNLKLNFSEKIGKFPNGNKMRYGA